MIEKSIARRDLSNNSFVKVLNKFGRSDEFKDLIFPPAKLFELEDEKDRAAQLAAKKEEARLLIEFGKPKVIEGELEKLQKQVAVLKENLNLAFAIEKPTIQSSLDALEKSVSELQKRQNQLSRLNDQKSGPSPAHTNLKNKIAEIVELFPSSQLLDLSSLTSFKNKDGLPAVTLFSLESADMSIEIGDGFGTFMARGYSDILDEDDHQVLFRRLRAQISAATGVRFGESDASSDKAFKQAISVARSEGWYKGSKKIPELYAESIKLTTKFAAKGGVIPNEARDLIKRVRSSIVFKNVYLLAEVDKWEVTYEELSGDSSPFIEGKIVNKPKTPDPLIVAPATIGKREYWFVLGAFDTTPIEKLIQQEFSTNPKA